MIDSDWINEEDEEWVDDEYENAQPVVFCKDCVHYVYNWKMRLGQVEPRCRRTFEAKVDIVKGTVSKPDPYLMNKCSTMREPSKACGKHGNWWKPSKETPEMTMLLLKRKANAEDNV